MMVGRKLTKTTKSGERALLTVEWSKRPDTYEIWTIEKTEDGAEFWRFREGFADWIFAIYELHGMYD